MPCDSSYMEPNASEIKEVLDGSEKLKAKVDDLVHFCDVVRDAIEAHLENDTLEVPRVLDGHLFVAAVKKQTRKLKDAYAYKSGHDYVQKNANVMFDIADKAIAQFDVINNAVNVLKRGEQLDQADIDRLRQDQIQHRMGDMMRVYRHFANKEVLTAEEVASVSNIDLTKPLTPQLGFDPDDV